MRAVNFAAVFVLSLGLAMDAAAVSAAKGFAVERVRLRHVVMVALFFGGAQALMPLAGWLIGASVGPLVQAWDHWIAFALLAALGCRMLWEARSSQQGLALKRDDFGLRVMFALAIATSIDAMAAGITLPMIGAPLLTSLLTIGITTALLSAAGLFAGHRFGAALGQRLDVAGGFILIALGVKILVDHMYLQAG
jgi:putative Mn2+ efflux pump MntP